DTIRTQYHETVRERVLERLDFSHAISRRPGHGDHASEFISGGKHASNVPDPPKSDLLRVGVIAGHRNGRATCRSQATMDVVKKGRHLMAVEASEQSHRCNRSLSGSRPMA